MTTSRMSEIIQHLGTTLIPRDDAARTDGQLLEAYVGDRVDAAFAALVRRHSAMVWGVCRRVLADYHDAEDAFQATFLVLVRKAASIVPKEMLANWLYGVANQTAMKARAASARRKRQERQVVPMPDRPVAAEDHCPDLKALLDAELRRLSAKYRVVVVLCDLEGKTRKLAAQQLGVPEGTVAGRLVRARTMLARRLAKRGVAPSAGALVAVLGQNSISASVPTSVISSTIRAASLFSLGQAAPLGAMSASVALLADGVLRTMLLAKLKAATLVLVLTIVAASLAVASVRQQLPSRVPTDKTDAVQKKTNETSGYSKQDGDNKEPPGASKENDEKSDAQQTDAKQIKNDAEKGDEAKKSKVDDDEKIDPTDKPVKDGDAKTKKSKKSSKDNNEKDKYGKKRNADDDDDDD